MFDREILETIRLSEQKWERQADALWGSDVERKFFTSSGIDLKPVYSPLDIEHLEMDALKLPGQYPFMRGNYPLHYQVEPMYMNQGYGMNTAEETRQRREWLHDLGSRSKGGQVTAVIAIDLPSQRGLDPDDPAAEGKVGECGVSISTADDIAAYFDDLPMEKVFTTLIAIDSVLPMTALLAAYIIDERKESVNKMLHVACNVHHHQWFWDAAAFPPRNALKISAEFIKWHIDNAPESFPGLIDGYNVAEAGAPPAMETAFNLAHTMATVKECQKVGIEPEEVVSRFWAHPHIGLNFFEEIAKIRANRKLWAEIFKERFGCQTDRALTYKVLNAQTAGVELTAQEAHNNIIRLTIMAMAGMMGDVEGMWISSYDEALGIPTEAAVQVCVRTYQILQEETDIPYVTDPLGGSYYVEWLTSKIEQEVLKILDQIERLGGYMKCWESGWLRKEVEREGARRFMNLQTGKKVKMGVNKNQVEKKTKVDSYRRPPEAEKKAILKVKKYRRKRDNSRVGSALEKVKQAALRIDGDWPDSCGILMPELVEAARAGATLGEMHKVLRDVFGYGYFSG